MAVSGNASDRVLEGQVEALPEINVESFLTWIKRRDVQVGALIVGLLMLVFLDFFEFTAQMWFNMDSYYQHGPLVPLGMAYILWVYRDSIAKHPVSPTLAPLPLLLLFMGMGVFFTWTYFFLFAQGWVFLGALCTGCWMVYGFRRAWSMAPALFFSATGLPMWGRLIDENTTHLQWWSTDGAFAILNMIGLRPHRSPVNPTVIYLDNFTMNVAAACSGMKLTLAMVASIVFIVIVARLKWWKNLVLIAMALPLAVVTNSLRVATIGVVGEEYGSAAGMWFHDYGSYLFLAMAFYVLWVVSKKLGWKV